MLNHYRNYLRHLPFGTVVVSWVILFTPESGVPTLPGTDTSSTRRSPRWPARPPGPAARRSSAGRTGRLRALSEVLQEPLPIGAAGTADALVDITEPGSGPSPPSSPGNSDVIGEPLAELPQLFHARRTCRRQPCSNSKSSGSQDLTTNMCGAAAAPTWGDRVTRPGAALQLVTADPPAPPGERRQHPQPFTVDPCPLRRGSGPADRARCEAPAADQQSFRADLDVVSTTAAARFDHRWAGSVRRLVGAEPQVPVRAKTFLVPKPGAKSGSSSASNASIGPRTCSWYSCRLSDQYALSCPLPGPRRSRSPLR